MQRHHRSIIVKQIVRWLLQARACPPSSRCNQSLRIVPPSARTSSISLPVSLTSHSFAERTVHSPAIQSLQGIIGKWCKTHMQRVLKSLLSRPSSQPNCSPWTYKKSTKPLGKARQQWELEITFFSHSIFVFILRSDQRDTCFSWHTPLVATTGCERGDFSHYSAITRNPDSSNKCGAMATECALTNKWVF